jgi:hypothetical protein
MSAFGMKALYARAVMSVLTHRCLADLREEYFVQHHKRRMGVP